VIRFARRTPLLVPAALAAAVIAGGCRASVASLGDSPDAARRNADGIFASLAFRFFNVQRDAKFTRTRPMMGQYALAPAKLYADTSLWTVNSQSDSSRAIYLSASYDGGRYFFQSRASAPYPAKIGDERHFMRLKSLGRNDYEWVTNVEHSIGPVRAADIGATLATLFTAFEGRSREALLADAGGTFPRAGRHLAQLVGIEALEVTPNADGTTSARFVFALRPDSLRGRYPNFARYLDKYIVPSVYRVQLTDKRGTIYLDANGRDGKLAVQLRAERGRLLPLHGVLRPLPDSLLIRVDFSAKFKIFRVGFRNLVGDFTIERGEHERAWMMRFRQEPGWRLPLAVDKLIHTPLRRPFEGPGAELRLTVRDDLGSQAMSTRQIRLTVNESAIMRWLSGLGGSAFSDFAERTEVEENRFLTQLFTAMREDVAALAEKP
jgi:hypothetical protein